jgi:hypothetical protein
LASLAKVVRGKVVHGGRRALAAEAEREGGRVGHNE